MAVRLVAVLVVVGFVPVWAGCGGGEDRESEDDGAAGATVNAPDGAGRGAAGDDGEAGRAGGSAPHAGSSAGEAGTDAADGGEPETPDDGGEPFVPVAITDVPTAFAAAICDALLACVGESALRELTDREDCDTRIEAELRATEFHHMDDAIASGHVLYDAGELPACLEGVRDLGCGVLSSRYPQPCVDVLAGNVAKDGECTISAECLGAAFCSGAAAGTCPSTCQDLLAQGAQCSADNECGEGLLCTGGSCESPSTAGEPCGGSSGMICALGFNCMGSTDVDVGECVDNASVQVGGEGDACEPGGALCMEGLSCVFDGLVAFHCEPRVSAGESCHLGLPGQCPVEQYCDAPSVMEEGTCRALPADGQECVLDDVCAPGLVCVIESDQPVCRPIRDNGEDCSDARACRSHRCDAGKCAPPPTCAS